MNNSRRMRVRKIKKIMFVLRVIFITTVVCILIFGGIKFTQLSKNNDEKQSVETSNELIEENTVDVEVQRIVDLSDTDNQATNVEEEQVEEKFSIEDKDVFSTEEEAINLDDEQVQKFIGKMSLEQKVAQLFFITPEALTGVATVEVAGSATKAAYETYSVGGIIYFAQNLQNPEQTREMLKNTQDYAKEICGLPVFLGVDEEGGKVLRVGNNDAFHVEKVDAMGEVVKSGSDAVYAASVTIGSYLADLQFNVDFAPDADVITNPENQVIGNRSFGMDPMLVKEMSAVYSNGLHENGILSCYKHFPGHGGTVTDTHVGTAYLNGNLEQLKQAELIPFYGASEADVDFVMVAHISVPDVIGSDEPASISRTMITDVLRDEIGFEGIIITDALQMGAVANLYSSGELAIKAIQAGNDMLLMPKDFKEAYHAILSAVENGVISEDRINESVERIVRAKIGL